MKMQKMSSSFLVAEMTSSVCVATLLDRASTGNCELCYEHGAAFHVLGKGRRRSPGSQGWLRTRTHPQPGSSVSVGGGTHSLLLFPVKLAQRSSSLLSHAPSLHPCKQVCSNT